MSAYAGRALIVTFPPVPHLRKRVPLIRQLVPAFLSFDLALFYSRALGPFAIKICKLFDSIAHRLVPAYLLGAAVLGRMSPTAAQLPRFCQGRRFHFSAMSTKFCT